MYSAGGAGGADQDDQASQLLLYNNLSMPGSKNLEIIFFMVNFMKNFMKFLESSFLGLGLKMFFRKWSLGTNFFKNISKFNKKIPSFFCRFGKGSVYPVRFGSVRFGSVNDQRFGVRFGSANGGSVVHYYFCATFILINMVTGFFEIPSLRVIWKFRGGG